MRSESAARLKDLSYVVVSIIFSHLNGRSHVDAKFTANLGTFDAAYLSNKVCSIHVLSVSKVDVSARVSGPHAHFVWLVGGHRPRSVQPIAACLVRISSDIEKLLKQGYSRLCCNTLSGKFFAPEPIMKWFDI